MCLWNVACVEFCVVGLTEIRLFSSRCFGKILLSEGLVEVMEKAMKFVEIQFGV